MNLLRPITDNIAEVLVMIIEFTQTRQKILVRNIQNAHSPGFVPVDLTADEFSDLLNGALDEHIRNRRLVLRDTDNVKFGLTGSFEAKPVVDENARELLEEDRDEYLEGQISKLLENSLNQRIAAELLRQRQATAAVDYYNRENRWEIEDSTYNE
jgi:flagellar basal body rod protein FlgB